MARFSRVLLAALILAVGIGAGTPVEGAATGSSTPEAKDLGTLGGTSSQAVAVNDKGQVVGFSSTAGDAESHAFFWTQKGGMVDLGTLGGTFSGAEAVNDNGHVVGTSSTAGDAEFHALLLDAEGRDGRPRHPGRHVQHGRRRKRQRPGGWQ